MYFTIIKLVKKSALFNFYKLKYTITSSTTAKKLFFKIIICMLILYNKIFSMTRLKLTS
uniref:Uncharacterized protein n=1 Tax=uncultured delta proteobacterium HF0130_19C20 TaxID=710828 RepID=E0XT51_9DELT|nr:hypothetical protein [uncultured delta proteobacterium HF0130_19C20]